MAFFESHPDRKTVGEEWVVRNWSAVMQQGAGKGERFLEEIQRALSEFGLPDTTIERKELITKLGGKNSPRVSLYVSGRTYHVFFSTEDYGKHLVLSELVAQDPKEAGVYGNAAFDREKTAAWFSFINAAKTNAVEKLANELKQDFSKINMQSSKGIIDIA